MNLLLLFPEDFVSPSLVRITGRRFVHASTVLRAGAERELTVGIAGGRIGRGVVTSAGSEAMELEIVFDREPPAPLPVTIVLALPRPKVLNRVVAALTSMGVKRIFLINAWRVEKSYWKTPRLSPENLTMQAILGLEQSRDTVLPVIELRRFFRAFVEKELPLLIEGTRALVAHPHAAESCPRAVAGPVTLSIGPEGGFINQEIVSLERAGFTPVNLGDRILRVETVLPALLGRMV
ncbi:MAG: 16S rRNA (uracil(1498)-N(3))-methyltransferase [Acidobacteriota bacterium]